MLALHPPPATSILDGIHAGLARLRDPAAELVDAVRRFDPGRDALVIGDFLTTVPDLDGRPCLAYRRPEWVALEDKTVVDAFWDRVGVQRASSLVVPAERAELLTAAARQANDAGSVWSGDTRDGFNGGAEFVRWVRTSAEADDAVRFFAAHCDRVRVMRFLDGIPCSVHGVLFPDHIAALRPVEMVACATRSMAAPAGSATPGAPRSTTRRPRFGSVCARLPGRFQPTELNPRMGAGLNVIARGLPDLPVQLLMDALVGNVDLGYDPIGFEADLVAAADTHRSGGTWRQVAGATLAPRVDVPLAFDGTQWRWAAPEEPAAGTLTTGPGAYGSFLRCLFDATETPTGGSLAGRAAAFWAFADRELGTGIGPLTAATT